MWSSIPIALLCMTVNLSEGKQGSGPKVITGGLSFVLPKIVVRAMKGLIEGV